MPCSTLGTFNDDIYGLPFSVSLPVGYYNMDVMAKAGITSTADQLPKTWDEVVEVCGKLREAGVKNPMFWGWNITGNWFLQALMWSQDKATMEGNEIQIASPEGLKALETMKGHLPRLRHAEYRMEGCACLLLCRRDRHDVLVDLRAGRGRACQGRF